jgi:hypothetical protein
MNPEFISVHDLTTLQKLAAKERRGRIVLQLPSLTTDETVRWQKILNDHYSHCGCSTGQVFVLALFIPYLISILFRFTYSMGWPWMWELACGLSVLLGSAVLGKTVGIKLARKRLRESVNDLVNVIKTRTELIKTPHEREFCHGLRRVSDQNM